MAEICVYGAGDENTLALRGMLTDAGLHVEFRDIRGAVGTEHRAFLITRGLTHIPQVFRANGQHMGGYEAALDELGL